MPFFVVIVMTAAVLILTVALLWIHLQIDPHCILNLADEPLFSAVRAELASSLDAWERRINDLGAIPERELIRRGLVEDRLGEYRARIKPLPARHRIGPATTLLEMHEAQAYPL